jgi:hypothetical protein
MKSRALGAVILTALILLGCPSLFNDKKCLEAQMQYATVLTDCPSN